MPWERHLTRFCHQTFKRARYRVSVGFSRKEDKNAKEYTKSFKHFPQRFIVIILFWVSTSHAACGVSYFSLFSESRSYAWHWTPFFAWRPHGTYKKAATRHCYSQLSANSKFCWLFFIFANLKFCWFMLKLLNLEFGTESYNFFDRPEIRESFYFDRIACNCF